MNGSIQIYARDIFDSKSTQEHNLGTIGWDPEGNRYRYVKAGASALVPGNVVTASAQDTAHQQLTPVAASIGATQVSIALGASAAAADLYAEGYAIVDTTPDLGSKYPIRGHLAISSSGTGVFHLASPKGLNVAWTTSSRISLQRNIYAGVIQAPTTLTGVPVGVAVFAIPAAEFGWIQDQGIAGVLIAGTPGVGLAVGVPGSAAGAVVIDGAATSGLYPIGRMCVTGVDGKVQAVQINFS